MSVDKVVPYKTHTKSKKETILKARKITKRKMTIPFIHTRLTIRHTIYVTCVDHKSFGFIFTLTPNSLCCFFLLLFLIRADIKQIAEINFRDIPTTNIKNVDSTPFYHTEPSATQRK